MKMNEEAVNKLHINTKSGEYPVIVGRGVFDRVNEFITGKCIIVSDSNVAPLYMQKLANALNCANVPFTVPAGEESKCEKRLFEILDFMAGKEFNRGDTVIALGGGVVGDLAGLCAGLYMRGIRLIMVPTTLLAMVDSSCGGKVAINRPYGKNMIGMFHQPSAVIADLDTLSTLDDEQISCGAAEMIKYGCIYDAKLFELLKDKNNLLLPSTINRCIAVKAHYIERDTLDLGERMMLNFGHTIGHAVEKAAGLLHGMAVAVGMYKEALLGEELGITQKGTAKEIKEILSIYGLPFQKTADGIESFIVHDKKSTNNAVKMALIEKIGKGVLTDVPLERIREALQ